MVSRRRRARVALLSVIALSALLGAAQSAAAAPSSWPQLGRNAAHTGVNPFETTLSSSNVPGLSEAWRFPIGLNAPSAPVVADGHVYTSEFADSLSAIDATTGRRTWTFTPTSGTAPTDPVVARGVVYTFADGKLYALDDQTGRVLRSTPMLDNGGLVYSNGVLYTMPIASDGSVPMGAYDAATGARLWTANVGGSLAPPAIADGEVFIVNQYAANGPVLKALSASTGKPLWSKLIGEQVNATPVVAGDTVVVVSINAHMWALNETTGAVRWKKTLAAIDGTWSAPAAYSGRLFQIVELGCNRAGRDQASITVRRLSTGAQTWTHVFENIPCAQALVGGGGPRTPTVANGLVYLPEMNAKKIRIFTAAGKLVTVFSTGEFTMSTVVVAAGRAFVSTWDPFLAPAGSGFVQAFAP